MARGPAAVTLLTAVFPSARCATSMVAPWAQPTPPPRGSGCSPPTRTHGTQTCYRHRPGPSVLCRYRRLAAAPLR
jgi:hypothetical protein